jgi:hypothetical protein
MTRHLTSATRQPGLQPFSYERETIFQAPGPHVVPLRHTETLWCSSRLAFLEELARWNNAGDNPEPLNRYVYREVSPA